MEGDNGHCVSRSEVVRLLVVRTWMHSRCAHLAPFFFLPLLYLESSESLFLPFLPFCASSATGFSNVVSSASLFFLRMQERNVHGV